MTPAGAPVRRPVWALAALAVLMALPPASAIGLVVAALALTGGIRLLRAVRAVSASRAPAAHSAMILGRDRGGAAVALDDRQLAAHGLILGASGAGKSTTLLAILSDHIERGAPVVAIDMKGSPAFERRLAAAAAAAGRPLRVFSPERGEHWNPLQHGNATELKDKLISSERFTEPHYQRAAERYVQLALGVLMEVHPSRPATLREVVDALEPRHLSALTRQLAPERAERVESYLCGLTPDQHSAVRGLGTRLAILSESHVGTLLEPGAGTATTTPGGPAAGIDLRRALEGEEVVLFSLHSSVYGKLSAQLGTLAIQDLVAATGHRLSTTAGGGQHQQAIVGIDEFSALGADNVISLLARGRESGVSVLLATQELADLDRAASGLRDQVLGNTAVKVVHRQDVPASAHTVARMTGTEKVWEQTFRVGGFPSRFDTSRGTRRQVEQLLIHPNEIMSLRTGEAVLLTKVPQTRARLVRVTAPAPAPALVSPAGPGRRSVGRAGPEPEARRLQQPELPPRIPAARPPAATSRRWSSPSRRRQAPERRQGPEIG
ncbi:MAG: DUF853 family protein [Actinomycetota bacterium]|nr:DUF853 family protein [Actinomycetota bacterium]